MKTANDLRWAVWAALALVSFTGAVSAADLSKTSDNRPEWVLNPKGDGTTIVVSGTGDGHASALAAALGKLAQQIDDNAAALERQQKPSTGGSAESDLQGKGGGINVSDIRIGAVRVRMLKEIQETSLVSDREKKAATYKTTRATSNVTIELGDSSKGVSLKSLVEESENKAGRRLARKVEVAENNMTLEDLIAELKKAGVGIFSYADTGIYAVRLEMKVKPPAP